VKVPGHVALWVAPSAVLLVTAHLIASHYRIPPPDRLGPEARAAAMSVLRIALGGDQWARPDHPQLERALSAAQPVIVTVWHEGEPVARVVARGEKVADALVAAARELPASPVAALDRAQLAAARIQVDVVGERAPLADDLPGLSIFAMHPGIDGIGAAVAGDELFALPDELARAGVLRTRQAVKVVPDLVIGYDLDKIGRMLANLGDIKHSTWLGSQVAYFRFRTDAFVEPPAAAADRTPLQLTRGVPPGPPVTADALRAAALTGARYLVAHLHENGRYVYESNLVTGKGTDPTRPRPYNLPRHAGTTYFLAELYRHTGEEFLREPIERAFRQFAQLVEEGGCTGKTPQGVDFACVSQKGDRIANLGSTALAVVALAEYHRATRDARHDDMAHRMAEWILMMQHDDGSFAHNYEVATHTIDHETQQLYYSGEAALALVRMHEVTGEARYRDAAERALDDLIGWYDFFAGGFFYGEDHWTCIAAEAAWPALKHRRYLDFCDQYGAFLRRQQMRPDDFPDLSDLAGTYGVTPFVIPNNTPVGSRTEAMLSAYLLGEHHGSPSEPLRQQILRSMEYALRQQVRPDSDFAVSPKADGLGALPASSINRAVRIDYVQHICSAMVRSIPLVEREQ
jgi:hypothetical protein